MRLTFKDAVRVYSPGVSLGDAALDIDPGLARAALCARVDGKLADLAFKPDSDCSVEFLAFDDPDGKCVFRHSASHILAQAVKRLFPDVKCAIGPATENGFYYDFDSPTVALGEKLGEIEAEMRRIAKADYPFSRRELERDAALDLFASEPYKLELISALPAGTVISAYSQGEFVDLCAGPHVPSSGRIRAFKLTSATGAYWRGDEHNRMLTRIYGTAFETRSALDEYIAAAEAAKKRDHNKLGRELGYFMTDETIGQGLPLLMPKGAALFRILSRFVEDEELRRGYLHTRTPYLAKRELYKISGHWDHYRDGMFVIGDPDSEGETLALRPMTCPFQYTIYKNGLKSYRDLPIRYGETSVLFRNESSGEMHGLIRVRQFTISEGHIVCRPDQVESEFKGALELAKFCLERIGLADDVSYRFSRRDPSDAAKYISDSDKWDKAESEMLKILDDLGVEYVEALGEAAFYGPKLDIQIRNVFGKEDTLITIQLDMFLAENFDMSYVDETGAKVRPYIIHRTSVGCYERTMALLIEKYGGALPVWLSPTQVRVLSLADRFAGYAESCLDRLRASNIRAESDTRSEKIGYKIREAQLEKIPYMLIVGEKESADGTVSVRARSGARLVCSLDDFIAKISKEIEDAVIE